MELYLVLYGVVVVLAPAVWLLLTRVAAHGGEQEGHVAEIAGPVLDQTAAFHGDDPKGRKPWDGVDRQKHGPEGFA